MGSAQRGVRWTVLGIVATGATLAAAASGHLESVEPSVTPLTSVTLVESAPASLTAAHPLSLDGSLQPTGLPEIELEIIEGNVAPAPPLVRDGQLWLSADGPVATLGTQLSGLDCSYPVGLVPHGRFLLYAGTSRSWPPGQPGGEPDRSTDLDETVTPTLRLFNAESGEDILFEDGACGSAWGANGRIAYVKGESSEGVVGKPSAGRIMVQDSPEGPATLWTSEAAVYTGLIWAQDLLVASRRPRVGPYLGGVEVVVFAGPDAERPLGDVAALSPDGAHALVMTGEVDGTEARVIRIADGAEVSSLLLGPERMWQSVWDGDTIVSVWHPHYALGLHPWPRFALATFSEGTLSVNHIFRLPQRWGGVGPFAAVLPDRFLNEERTHLGLWYQYAGSQRYLVCDAETAACKISPLLDPPFHRMENRSRPLERRPDRTPVTEATQEMPEDRCFEKWSAGVGIARLHLTEHECGFWRDHLLFREERTR